MIFGKKKRYPGPILQACRALELQLPKNASPENPPSYYVQLGGKENYKGYRKHLAVEVPDVPEEEIRESFFYFKSLFLDHEPAEYTFTDQAVYFTDWLLFARRKGFSVDDYFDYELYAKDVKARNDFFNHEQRFLIMYATSVTSGRVYMNNKAIFYSQFHKYVHRDWINTYTCEFDEFEAFLRKHSNERVFAKPVIGGGGTGSGALQLSDYKPGELFEICKDNKYVLEEFIHQHETMAKFNRDSVNTVRIVTFLPSDNKPRVMAACVRFGTPGSVVDNYIAGGVCTVLDTETGKPTVPLINKRHQRTMIHPYSGESIENFQVPYWDKVREAVLECQALMTECRHVGWDVTITDKGEVEFVEGNCGPDFDVVQAADSIGKFPLYEPFLRDIPEAEKLLALHDEPWDSNYYELPELKTHQSGGIIDRLMR